jgi:hypothetical protein
MSRGNFACKNAEHLISAVNIAVYCAISWKVAGLIPEDATGFFD